MVSNSVAFLLQAQNEEFASIFNLEDYKGVFLIHVIICHCLTKNIEADILDTQTSSVLSK